MIFSWLTSKVGQALAKALAVLAAISAVFVLGRKSGKDALQARILKKDVKRRRAGRNAAANEKSETTGMSNSDLVDRLRRRDGDWGGL